MMILVMDDRHMHMTQMPSPKGWNMTKYATAPPAKTYSGNQQASLLWLPVSFQWHYAAKAEQPAVLQDFMGNQPSERWIC